MASLATKALTPEQIRLIVESVKLILIIAGWFIFGKKARRRMSRTDLKVELEIKKLQEELKRLQDSSSANPK